jgi:hypothetical protein
MSILKSLLEAKTSSPHEEINRILQEHNGEIADDYNIVDFDLSMLSPIQTNPTPGAELPQKRKKWQKLPKNERFDVFEIKDNIIKIFNQNRTKIFVLAMSKKLILDKNARFFKLTWEGRKLKINLW